ncbi:hypothetical protein KCU73_g111, partial [Aureobasidium melanogenum]
MTSASSAGERLSISLATQSDDSSYKNALYSPRMIDIHREAVPSSLNTLEPNFCIFHRLPVLLAPDLLANICSTLAQSCRTSAKVYLAAINEHLRYLFAMLPNGVLHIMWGRIVLTESWNHFDNTLFLPCRQFVPESSHRRNACAGCEHDNGCLNITWKSETNIHVTPKKDPWPESAGEGDCGFLEEIEDAVALLKQALIRNVLEELFVLFLLFGTPERNSPTGVGSVGRKTLDDPLTSRMSFSRRPKRMSICRFAGPTSVPASSLFATTVPMFMSLPPSSEPDIDDFCSASFLHQLVNEFRDSVERACPILFHATNFFALSGGRPSYEEVMITTGRSDVLRESFTGSGVATKEDRQRCIGGIVLSLSSLSVSMLFFVFLRNTGGCTSGNANLFMVVTPDSRIVM